MQVEYEDYVESIYIGHSYTKFQMVCLEYEQAEELISYYMLFCNRTLCKMHFHLDIEPIFHSC